MEMNMHMPQNVLAEIELRHLAAIPYQIISPSSNAPIIGIYQDSMLGSYRFTRSSIDFTPREAMNMLMSYPNVNVSELRGKKSITNFEILSQITPPISMKYKTKQFDDKTEDAAISNNVLEIHNGKYLRGQADKPVFASGTKGILSRIFNDFGNMAASNYIDDLQQVITEYMKTSAYSVGVSDLISDRKTTESILQIIDGKKSDVQQLMDKVQLGILENNTGKSNMIEFETQVNNVLNKATEQSGSTAVKSLSKNNRFVIMVNSGSKGSLLNISQMISCLGQQNVDGKRIPYGFDNRTLPHFSKYDDSPGARGFIENSYISGLTAPELFFHAMGGRIGLIDTAVKTSQTGYIQRRLVKGLEDLKVEYDMTVRNNMGKIIQFAYGDDSIDATRVENQSIPLVTMSIEDIYMHYDIIGLNDSDGEMIKIFTKGAATRLRKQRDDTRAMCKKYVDYMVEHRDKLVDMVFKYRNDDFLKTPVAFQYLIQNVQGQLGLNANSAVDITPLECFEMAEATFNGLRKLNYCKPTKLMEVLFFFYLSPKELLVKKRFNRSAMTLLLENVVLNYKKSIVHPGEMVGVIAGQSIGEPTTQMSLTKNEAIKVMVKIDGDVRIISTTIGEFCDKIIQNNPSFTFNTGHHDSVETILQDEYYIMSVKEDETAEWCKISHVSKHPVNGRLMNVRTRSGRIVETTTSHSHLIRNNNRVEPITGADMRVGMRIPVAKKIPNTFVKETVKIGETEVKLDKTFGWFVGAYLAEGSVNYDERLVSHINKLAVPEYIFLSSYECKEAFLLAYIKHSSEIRNNMLYIKCANNQLTKDISLLFNYFDIFAIMNGLYLLINPCYSDKLVVENDCDILVDDIDKINGLSKTVNDCFEILGINDIENCDSIGRRTLQKYIGVFEQDANASKIVAELNILRQAAQSNVVWDEIVELDIYEGDQTEYVYDFTVPQHQTFMTDYGVYVHNTLNSVTYETEIIVRNRAGKIQKVQIGDFTNKFIGKAVKKEYYSDTDTTYAELEEYYEVPSCNEEGKITWDRVEAVTKHPVKNKDGTNVMLKITTKEHREVIATKAKSFLKLVNGKIDGIDGENLKVGDYLPVSKKTIEFTETKKLDLKTVLPPTEYIYSSEVEKAKLVMNETHWWKTHNGKTFVLPYKRSDSFVSKMNVDKVKKGCKTKTVIANGCVYTKQTSMNAYNIPEQIELNYNFGYLIGAYAAEGCMTKTQISIANNDAAYFQPILELCKQWNINTKVYRHENKCEDGWTSQDLRIYNTLLCRLLESLCGKLSHNKFVSDIITFSNKECIRGFLDAYIGGDGTISKKSHSILMNSVSKQLLIDVQQMLNIMDIYSFISKPKKPETNNRGSQDIKQCYQLNVVNQQAKKLATILRMKLVEKQETCIEYISAHTYKYEFCRNALTVPNEIDGELVFEEKNDRYADVLFDKIISIEEIDNTTPYAYDLTVENTRNFNIYNGLCQKDTFHLAGVSSKSNVTRGVPRIEEILRLTENPKRPSATVYMKPYEQHEKDRAANYCNMIQYTKLVDVVKSVEICFDPNDHATHIHADRELIDQFYEFENMMEECNKTNDALTAGPARSKWVVRIEIDAESLLDKNITMDDIHFAISKSHESDVSCIYSDMNSSNLVFRIRLNASVFKGPKKGAPESLDQSDEIYMLKNFQDSILNNIVLRGVNGITNVNPRLLKDMVVLEDSKYVRKDTWVLDTIGSNLLDLFTLDFIDYTRTYSNDIREVYDVLGIEAARQNVVNEIMEVMEASDAYVNYHHLSILCDRMTVTSRLVPMFRSGILSDDTGPISKGTFEMHTEVFLDASRHGEFDQMRGVSANVMCGQPGYYGTNSFGLVLDMKAVEKMNDADMKRENTNDKIESMFNDMGLMAEKCSMKNIRVDNNVHNLRATDMGSCGDDGYDVF